MYVVKTGDSLWSLARERGITVNDILSLNRLKPGASLRAGQKITLPAGKEDKASAVTEKKPSETKKPGNVKIPGNGLSWPIDGIRDRMQGKVQGVEIAGNKGDIVRAVSTGIVVWSGPYRGYGEVAFVKTGDRILPGAKLGELGIDARRGAALAYLMIFKGSKAVDPFKAPRD